jgi:hypothetical protein
VNERETKQAGEIAGASRRQKNLRSRGARGGKGGKDHRRRRRAKGAEDNNARGIIHITKGCAYGMTLMLRRALMICPLCHLSEAWSHPICKPCKAVCGNGRLLLAAVRVAGRKGSTRYYRGTNIQHGPGYHYSTYSGMIAPTCTHTTYFCSRVEDLADTARASKCQREDERIRWARRLAPPSPFFGPHHNQPRRWPVQEGDGRPVRRDRTDRRW